MNKLNPIEQSKYIESKFREYIKSTFQIEDEIYENEFKKELDKAEICRGPFISTLLPFSKGHSLNELVKEGVICGDFLKLSNIDFNRNLYVHQERALKLIDEGHNAVITTGTGSGKTECFLYPILNHILKENKAGNGGKGIVALFLYPMNALVNDQMDRIRDVLRDYPDITFGFFTGDTVEKNSKDLREKLSEKYETIIPQNEIVSREEIRNNTPNLLFTNYSMLEHLLIRPSDFNLFADNNINKWQFVVLDEAHTYNGALGIELALLLRRVKGIANRNPQFILTSATLGDGSKDINKIIEFAENLTSSKFSKEDIVFAKRENFLDTFEYRIRPEYYNDIVECIEDKNKLISIINEINPKIKSEQTIDEMLYDILIKDENVFDLYKILDTSKSKTFKEVLNQFNKIIKISPLQLINLIFIISRANKNGAMIFDSKYHTFIRTLDGAFITIGKDKRIKINNCKTIDDMITFEIGLCKYCNKMYIMGKIYSDKNGVKHLRQNSDTDIDENYGDIDENVSVEYFLLDDILDVDEKNQDKVEKCIVCSKCGAIYFKDDINARVCKCGDENSVELLHVVNEGEVKNNLTTCMCCNRSSRDSIGVVSGFHLSKDSATALLSQILYETLESKEINENKNIPVNNFWEVNTKNRNNIIEKSKQFIAFSDSRQQASYFATFYNYTHKRFLRKRILWEEIKKNNHNEITVSKLIPKLSEEIYNNKLFNIETFDDAERESWITILAELLNIDGNYTAEGLGIFLFKLNEDEIKRKLKQEGVILDEFLKGYNISEKDFFAIIQVLFQIFRNSAALNYNDANIDLEIRKEEFAYRSFENYIVIRKSKEKKEEKSIKGDNRRSFLPVGENGNNKLTNYIKRTLNLDYDKCIEFLSTVFEFGKRYVFKEISDKAEKLYQIDAKNYTLSSYKNTELFYCPICKKVTSYNVKGICPTNKCNGILKSCNPDEFFDGNYYRREYMNKTIENIKIQEHTAQIDRDKGREYQRDFKNQKINVLSCSTTFEMGIDIGKLENVFLRNVPPTPANYAQRAGRAGRSKDSSAFVLTFCGASSHDFTYFNEPTKMIVGSIAPPNFKVTNEKIIIRHITASAFGFFFRKYPEYFQNVEALVCNGGIEKFIEYLNSRPTDLLDYIDNKILDSNIRNKFGNYKWINLLVSEDGILNNYDKFLKQKIEELEEARIKASNVEDYQTANYYKSQIIQEKNSRVIESLSEFCVIPKYGFPVDVVDLKVFEKNGKINSNYNLSRDLTVAISEYAPDSEIIVDNRKYTSRYINKPRGISDLTRYYYYTCPNCERLNVAEIPSKIEYCRYCNTLYNEAISEYFIEPIYGFSTDRQNKESTTKKPRKTYAGEYKYIGDGIKNNDRISYNNYVFVESANNDELLIMNVNPFYRCNYCGYTELIKRHNGNMTKKEHKNHLGYNCENNVLQKVAIGHVFKTDVVKINVTGLIEKKHALSLLYALLEGISEAFDIERKDINGILNRNEDGFFEIIIFDNVPGGAGHVKRILDRDGLKKSFMRAYDKVNMNCCDEETSCYNCLRNYNNQRVHNELKRRYAKEILSDILENIDDNRKENYKKINLNEAISYNDSYSLDEYNVWEEVSSFIEGITIDEFAREKIRIPDYAISIIKYQNKEIYALAIWKNEKIVILNNEVNEKDFNELNQLGLKCYRANNINYEEIKDLLKRE